VVLEAANFRAQALVLLAEKLEGSRANPVVGRWRLET